MRAPAKLAYQTPDEPQDGRQVLGGVRGAEVLIHFVGAGEQLAKPLVADGQGDGQPDGGPQGVAPADPVPETEHVVGVDAEGRDPLGIGGNCHEVVGDRRFIPQGIDQPIPGAVGVGHGLLGGEGLGGDHEEGGGRLQVADGLGQVGAVHVGDEVDPQLGGLVGLEGLANHQRAQVGAADADVDHIGDAVARVAAPCAAANLVRERLDLRQDGVDLGHDVLAIHQDGPVAAVAQRNVEDGAVLGVVDVLPGEHAPDPALKIHRLGEVEKQPERLLR